MRLVLRLALAGAFTVVSPVWAQNPPNNGLNSGTVPTDTIDQDDSEVENELDSLLAPPPVQPVTPTQPMAGTDSTDQPFENALEPEEDLRRRWSVGMGYSRASVENEGAVTNWNTSVTRDWHLGDWTPSVSLGWSRTGSSQLDTNEWRLGSALSWDFTESFSWELAASWYPVTSGEQGGVVSTGVSWFGDWGEHFTPDASLNGTWDRFSRGDVQAGVGISPSWEYTGGSLSGYFDYQDLSYQDAAGRVRSNYTRVWSWATNWALKYGNWSTGPAWSGDYARVNATAAVKVQGSGKTKVRLPKVPATGVLVNQEYLWNLTWKPLTGIALSVDLFKTTGSQTSTVKSTATELQKATLAKWSQATQLPQDSKGIRTNLSIYW